MLNFKKILFMNILVILLIGCSAKNPSPVAETAYPNPIQPTMPFIDSVYPGPSGGNGGTEVIKTPAYLVSQLVVPTPSVGKAVITGKLLIDGEGGRPYLTNLYLAKAIPPSIPGYPPLIGFSEQTDPQALQDAITGRFVFTDISPGQYAFIIWTPVGGNPLKDESGNMILITVAAGESKDVGIIPIK